ncbi:hypothetical protein HGRIS_011779 [Hohenbuehelia grisea]|uniref:Peptidase M43 pregnancy-associated plasma-A domain-containing protein n=1 Tax=Hohenbuehelia grisea TaxID=104357 RepID=A0ABR3JXW2_9AGAR
MHSTTFFTFLFACSSVLAGPAQRRATSLTCASEVWNKTAYQDLPEYSHLRARDDGNLWRPPKQPSKDPGNRVPVYWSIFSTNDTIEGGNIPDELIHKQMDVLNRDFQPVGLTFKLEKIKRTTNHRWFDWDSQRASELEFKATLSEIDDASALRIFLVRDGIAAFTLLPGNGNLPSQNLDGVIFTDGGLPGWPNHDSVGHLLTHEVGHWCGLPHTFDNSNTCVDGDQVTDTPVSKKPEHMQPDNCKKPTFSCGGSTPDPNDNYMNYVWDTCRKRFTPGQIERMRKELKLRGITLGAPTASTGTQTDPENTTSTGTQTDTGNTTSTGTQTDTRNTTSTGTQTDTGNTPYTGTRIDTGNTTSTGTQIDTGNTTSTGTQTNTTDTYGYKPAGNRTDTERPTGKSAESPKAQMLRDIIGRLQKTWEFRAAHPETLDSETTEKLRGTMVKLSELWNFMVAHNLF